MSTAVAAETPLKYQIRASYTLTEKGKAQPAGLIIPPIAGWEQNDDTYVAATGTTSQSLQGNDEVGVAVETVYRTLADYAAAGMVAAGYEVKLFQYEPAFFNLRAAPPTAAGSSSPPPTKKNRWMGLF